MDYEPDGCVSGMEGAIASSNNTNESKNPSCLVEYHREIDVDGEIQRCDWCVVDPTLIQEERSTLLWGFATKIDAEIAAKFVDELEPDYTLESPYFWWQFEQYGGSREGVMKAACERLRW